MKGVKTCWSIVITVSHDNGKEAFGPTPAVMKYDCAGTWICTVRNNTAIILGSRCLDRVTNSFGENIWAPMFKPFISIHSCRKSVLGPFTVG